MAAVVSLSILAGFLLIYLYLYRQKIKAVVAKADSEWERAESNQELKKILALWLEERDKGKVLHTYFEERNFYKIAIYGMAELGRLLYRELKKTNIEVVYCIDIKAETLNLGMPIVKPEEVEKNVDVIVVTPVYHFAGIFDVLNERLDGSVPIIGLDEIIYSLEDEEKE